MIDSGALGRHNDWGYLPWRVVHRSFRNVLCLLPGGILRGARPASRGSAMTDTD